jgi:hypothetical protein
VTSLNDEAIDGNNSCVHALITELGNISALCQVLLKANRDDALVKDLCLLMDISDEALKLCFELRNSQQAE